MPWHGLRLVEADTIVPVDALFQRYFGAVTLALVAVAGYFQAAGAGSLLGGAVLPSERVLTVAPKPNMVDLSPLAGRAVAHERRSAEAVKSRNPFDSVGGPLNAQALELPGTDAVQVSAATVVDPLGVPACEDVSVAIVTESTDPTWSLAALKGPGDAKPRLRRVGDQVGARQVAFIGFNPTEGSPAVWLEGSGALCQALLFRTQPTVPAAPAGAAGPAAPAAARKGEGPATVPPDIAKRIQRVSDTEYNVDRAVVDRILENQAELMRSARIVPEQQNGQVVGIRLFGIRPDTLLGTLGLQNGDRLETINGFSMGSPEKALEAYARLRTATSLKIQVNRRGQPVTIEYKIK